MTAPQWFYVDGTGAQQGPMTTAALQDAAAKGQVHGDTLAWRDGMSEWTPYRAIAELAERAAAPMPPPAQAAPRAQESRPLIDLKQRINLPTGKFLLLTIATMGFYAYFWILKHTPLLREASGKPIASEAYLVTTVGLASWGGVFGPSTNETVALLGVAMLIAAFVMLVVWAFRAKDALRAYAAASYGIDYPMNAFYTLIFGYFYINYCINEIPEEQARLRTFAQRQAA
jgi:hypothetical protein